MKWLVTFLGEEGDYNAPDEGWERVVEADTPQEAARAWNESECSNFYGEYDNERYLVECIIDSGSGDEPNKHIPVNYVG